MPIPDYQTLMLPVLKLAANGEVSLSDVRAKLGDDFQLSNEERSQLLPSGSQATFSNRVHWAKTYLQKAGLLESTKRGHFKITEEGSEVLSSQPKRIDVAFLNQFPAFQQFHGKSQDGVAAETEPAATVVEPSSKTPDELLRLTHGEIEKALRLETLEHVLAASPDFFERLIVTLLVGMGYGGSREDAGRAIGKSGDGGLDGVIDQDPLGLDRVYIQAKRYNPEHAVSEPEIRGFAGSLDSVKAAKGVFVTTSYFTSPATAFAEKVSRRIILIDGDHLTRLMIRYDIGVRIEETFHIKKIDEDFFTTD